MKIRNFQQANAYLETFIPNNPKVSFQGAFGLDRSKYLLKLLGSPQNNLKIIHIAGTSGKGSTAYLTSIILHSLGFKVGLHVSPYLIDIRERVQINNKLIGENKFVLLVNRLIPVINQMKKSEFGQPTYFDLTVTLAYLAFYEEHVDYAVVETGLGGWYDSTNTINRQDKLVVLTKIGLDHTDILGATIDKVAYQKAKIIKKENLVVSTHQDTLAEKVITQVVKQNQTQVYYLGHDFNIKNIRLGKMTEFDYKLTDPHLKITNIHLGLLGIYQAENCALALTATYLLSKRDKFIWMENRVTNVLKQAKFPGRLDIKKIKGKIVVFDGAHNPQKMAAFLQALQKLYPDQQFSFLLAFKKGKDYDKMLSLLLPIAKKIYVTSFSLDNQDLPQLATAPEFIGHILQKQGYNRFHVIPHAKEAFSQFLEKEYGTLVVTGSFYLLSVIYKEMLRRR